MSLLLNEFSVRMLALRHASLAASEAKVIGIAWNLRSA